MGGGFGATAIERKLKYVQTVGRLEAEGWLVRVYVNHEIATG